MNDFHHTTATLLKALGHPVRCCIVERLLRDEGTVGAMVSCTGVPQPTVSQHLSILKAARIVECERRGTQVVYRVCSEQARQVMAALRTQAGAGG